MRKIIAIMLIASFAFACKYDSGQTQAQLKENLKKTMNDFLYRSVKNDSSVVKFHVLDVTYYINKDNYACEFKVNMHERNLDTTGTMAASISKDFTKVVRGY